MNVLDLEWRARQLLEAPKEPRLMACPGAPHQTEERNTGQMERLLRWPVLPSGERALPVLAHT